MKLRSVNLLCAVLLMCAVSAQAMSTKQGQAAYQNVLDISLLHACQDIENPATWSELGVAALHCQSVQRYRLQDIKNRLQRGANANAVIKYDVKSGVTGWTPFHWAVGNNSPELVALLLRHGADVNKKVEGTKKNSLPMTPFGMMMANNELLAAGLFDTQSLRSRTAQPVSLEDAVRSNIKIGIMLADKGVAPRQGTEAKFAAFLQMNGTDFSNVAHAH